MKKNQGGYMLVVIVLALTLLAILVPALIQLVQKDSKDAQGTVKKTTSFQLAEAGQDRGAWKLRESDAMYTAASTGSVIGGYNNDVTYTDVSGGSYKIQISAGPNSGDVTIISKGLASNNTDVRAIKGIYNKGVTQGALSVVGGLNWRPNLHVEWGPVVCYQAITSTPANRYPRKYSAAGITGYDTDPNAPNGAEPGDNWANYDYASYYNLGTAPSVNIAQYISLAKNSCVPPMDATSGSGAAAHTLGPGGCDSGYYTADVNLEKAVGTGDYLLTCSTCVIYISGDVKKFDKGFLDIKALVVTGNMDFNADDQSYTATIPSHAQDEYQYVPTATAYWASKGWTNSGTTVIAGCGFHGFLYVGGNLNNAGGGVTMVGAMWVVGDVSVNTTTVYYDESVAGNILFTQATVNRTSWDEIRTAW